MMCLRIRAIDHKVVRRNLASTNLGLKGLAGNSVFTFIRETCAKEFVAITSNTANHACENVHNLAFVFATGNELCRTPHHIQNVKREDFFSYAVNVFYVVILFGCYTSLQKAGAKYCPTFATVVHARVNGRTSASVFATRYHSGRVSIQLQNVKREDFFSYNNAIIISCVVLALAARTMTERKAFTANECVYSEF